MEWRLPRRKMEFPIQCGGWVQPKHGSLGQKGDGDLQKSGQLQRWWDLRRRGILTFSDWRRLLEDPAGTQAGVQGRCPGGGHRTAAHAEPARLRALAAEGYHAESRAAPFISFPSTRRCMPWKIS